MKHTLLRLLAIVALVAMVRCSRAPAEPYSEFSADMVGNIFPGKEIYLQANKLYVGKIVEADPGRRMVLIKFADGTVEWRNWDAVLEFPWCVAQ